jgi:hypothetical protein
MIMDVMNQPSASKNASVLWSTRPRLLPKEALAFRPIGYVADRVAMEPRIPATPGPVAEKPCCGAVRSLSFRQIRGCQGFTSTCAVFSMDGYTRFGSLPISALCLRT